MRRAVAAALLMAALGAASTARAQDVLLVQYAVGFPAGDTRDFTDEVSFLGLDLGFRRFTGRTTSWGAMLGFQVFDENTMEVVAVPGGHVSGTQYRYVNDYSLYLGGQLHLGWGAFRPYVAANIGAHLITRQARMGIGRWEDTGIHGAVAPEAGLLFPAGHYSGILSVRYHLTTSSDDYRHSHLAISLGVADDF